MTHPRENTVATEAAGATPRSRLRLHQGEREPYLNYVRSARADRLRCCGNGVIEQQAAWAFYQLYGRLFGAGGA